MKKNSNITTILGILGAIFAALKPYYDNGDFDFQRDKYVLLQAVGLAIFGYFVGDRKSNQGESHNIPQNEKTTTVAGQDTSKRETSRPQIFEDHDGALTVITEPRSATDNSTDTGGAGRSVEAGTGSPAENI